MRVVIGEDEALLRDGLALLLQANGMRVVGTAGDADHLVNLTRATTPDIVITDIRMPPTHSDDGLRAALTIRAAQPPMPVMVLSQYVQRRYAVDLLAGNPAGVGYQLKQRIADVERFCADVRTVAAGGTSLDPEVVELMVNRATRSHTGTDQLTGRQRQVLALIAEGRTNTAIAARLNISDKAVVQHTSHIYQQLGLPAATDDHRRVLAVIRYLTA
jgi:DNA-binding NarL/FixJ family response regulator